jgi:hypothetical protein
MNKLIEIRNQEMMCRERALLESERRAFWLAKAEEWGQRAPEEIAFHFRECDGASFTAGTASNAPPVSRLPSFLLDPSRIPARVLPFCEWFGDKSTEPA